MAFVIAMSDERRIQLGGNEELMRPFTLANNWTKLRIGVRCRIMANITLTTNARMLLGLCNGSNGYTSDGTVDWLGVSVGLLSSNTWTRVVGASPYTYLTAPTSSTTLTKVGTTITSQNSNVASGASILIYPAAFHSHFCWEITRGSPNYTIQFFGMSAAQVVTDVTRAAFFTMMETDTLTLTTYSNVSAFAYSGPGVWDRISFFWSSFIAPLEISDIAIARYL